VTNSAIRKKKTEEGTFLSADRFSITLLIIARYNTLHVLRASFKKSKTPVIAREARARLLACSLVADYNVGPF